jgi:small subunit ribosomal protein S17
MAENPEEQGTEATAEEQQVESATPAAESEAPAEQPQADSAEPEATEAEAAADTGAESGDAGAPAGDAAEGAPAQAGPELSPKERRRTTRSRHAGEPRPTRSPEERHAERLAERRVKAARRRARRVQERSATAGPAAPAGAGQLAAVKPRAEGKRKVRQGVVISDKSEKTIVVRIDVARRHRRYEKIVRSSSTLHAHDENNDAHEGDMVRVIESRPLSRSKRWNLVEVLERAR